MNYRDYVGNIVSEENIVVENELLKRFSIALKNGDLSPKPQHLPLIAYSTFGNFDHIYELLDIKPRQILHSRESIQVCEPLAIGDQVRIQTIIADLFEQQASSAPMGFIHAVVVGEKSKKPAFKCERIIAVRGGFPRS